MVSGREEKGSGRAGQHSLIRTRMELRISCTRGCCARVAHDRVEGGRIVRAMS